MPNLIEDIKHELLTLLSLNRYPIERNVLLSLMKHPVMAEAFPNLSGVQYPNLMLPVRMGEMLGNRISYSSNDNSFALTSEAENEELAFEAIQARPALAEVMAKTLNRMAMPEPFGQKRDIRNFFYSGNWNGLLRCLKEAEVIYNEKKVFCNPGQVFDFVRYHLQSPWIENMDVRMLNMLCCNFLPYGMLCLLPMRHFVEVCQAKVKELSINSQVALADYHLMNGDFEKADALLQKLPDEMRLPREAWRQFQAKNIDEAVKLYLTLLKGLKRQELEAFLSSFPGIYAVFALLATRKAEHRARAMRLLEGGKRIPLLGDAFADLFFCLQKMVVKDYKESEAPYEYRRDCCEFGNYLRAVGFFWLEEEKPDLFFRLVEECRDEYPVLLDDCLFIQSYYQKRQPSPRQSAAGGVVNCWQVRPVWERIMGNIVKISKGQKSDSQYRRLCWFCSYNPNDEFPVTMRPVEQKLGKHGDWSKGKQFNLRSYAQDREWPSFFTLQDQLICNILADELNTPEGHLLKGNAFASPRALETAIGHPLLFWDGTFQHFECLRGEPSFWLRMLDEGATIAFAPQIQPGGVVVKHTAQDNLLLFAFDAGQTLMAAEIGTGLFVPENALPSITTFIRAMVQDISFFSEMSLLFTGLKSKPSSNELHVRLHPMDTRMKVELFLMPFPNSKELFLPGEGPLESVICEAGIPVRIVRDFELEGQTVREFLEECPTLADANPLGAFTWELENTESCLDFSLALQGMLDKIHVYWPDNKRFKTSRRLTKNDLSIHCRSEGDWLFSLDGSVTLDDGQVVAMKEMLKGLKQRHGNYIVLDDGQVLALADSFRSQLESIAASVSISDDSLHFTKVMTPFMRSLLQDSLPSGELAELDEKVDEIAEAMKLEPEVPIGLLATLRPYQLEGFKWLCRLDAWGVGACLADDMGLGKTVQVIAFMLRYASEGPMLVVAPTSVCNNWLSELERFAPSLDVCVFGGTHRTELFQDLGPNMVMITSYGLLQSEEKSFCAVKWRCVVLDEAQAIKNHNTKRAQAVIDLNAKFRMVTTGTPLENNLNELWSIFNFVNPGLLDSHSHFQERFAVPIEAEKDKEALERLSNIVKPFILRRLKREVLQELPQKTEISLQVSLSEEESAFYEALRSELLDEIHRINDDSGRLPIRVIAAITKLRLAVCNSKLIDPPPSIPIPSSKMEAFLELLDELLQAHHKILVFSQFVKHLKLVENEIQKRGIAYQYLDGDMNAKERTVAVNAFQRGKGDVFLISLRAGGMGLNLTAADYVIHLDPWWNPAVEDQASDRAYRIGQDKPVTIYRLIAKNTIESKIIELHQSKRELAENLLQGTDVFNQITKDDLIRLLKN